MSTNRRKTERAPKVDDQTALRLWTKAGGRCSFPGCPNYLLRDDLTPADIKHGHIAHIVAATLGGPRGNDPLLLSERSKIDNLILVCQVHHFLVDNHDYVETYPKELLLQYKREHEERIYELTGCTPDRRSRVLSVRARIADEVVSVSHSERCRALFQQGLYPREATTVEIDLTDHPNGDTAAFIEYGKELIQSKVDLLYKKDIGGGEAEHLSVFAIGPIPLLVYLGSRLSNKVPTTLYQRHRDLEDWVWKEEPGSCRYSMEMLQEGADQSNVALILSLSGKITIDQLPKHISDNFYIYEITLEGADPSPTLFQCLSDLQGFQAAYDSFLSLVRKRHSADTVHLFPAIPAPVAVMCGRELLHKVSPSLSVYDNQLQKGGFKLVLEV